MSARIARALLLALAPVLLLAACGGGESASSSAAGSRSGGGESVVPPAQVFGSEVRGREDGAFGLDRGRQVPVSEPGLPDQALRVSYPAGSISPSASRKFGAPEGGMQVYLPRVDGTLDEAYLRYWVRFPAGFAFAKGGKLPGLWGGSQVSGGEEPDGTDGFSTRLMWRSNGAGEVYLYAPGHSGTSLGRGDWTWPTGRWACVEQHVALNAPDRSDGSVTTWLDGRLVYRKTDLRYRTVDSLQIEGIFFSTFFGGSDPSWASPKDQYADFTGFALSTSRIGCS